MTYAMGAVLTHDVDWDRYGTQHRSADVIWHGGSSGGRSFRLPITIVAGSRGPTMALTAGIHGDEFEGPTTLHALARALQPADLTGRVLILPALNPPALQARSRCSPLDGRDMNRSFPGCLGDTPTDAIARFVSTEILPRAEMLFDLHAGGNETDLMPCVMTHFIDDHALFDRALDAARAFGAPAALAIEELETDGMIDVEAVSQGKVFGCAELGGGGMLRAETLSIAAAGVRNLLRHFGMLRGAPERERWRESAEQSLLRVDERRRFVVAETPGVFRPVCEAGDPVRAGECIGLHLPLGFDPAASPCQLLAPVGGVLYLRAAGGPFAAGDTLAIIAERCDTREDWRRPLRACRQQDA